MLKSNIDVFFCEVISLLAQVALAYEFTLEIRTIIRMDTLRKTVMYVIVK